MSAWTAPSLEEMATAIDLLERFLLEPDDDEFIPTLLEVAIDEGQQVALTLLMVTSTMCSILLSTHEQAPWMDRRQLRDVCFRGLRMSSAEVLDLVDGGGS